MDADNEAEGFWAIAFREKIERRNTLRQRLRRELGEAARSAMDGEALPDEVEKLAARVWEIGCADAMITVSEAKERWSLHRAARSQQYLDHLYNAKVHLEAMRDLSEQGKQEAKGDGQPGA